MSDDITTPQHRGAAPPVAAEVIGTAKPFFIELPFDDSFLSEPDVLYEGGRTLEEAVEHLAELGGHVNDDS